jgi:glycosyltransferase involved in cell wall biosynthesis
MTGIARPRIQPLPSFARLDPALHTEARRSIHSAERVRPDGGYLACGGDAFRVRGVTYGSFLPRRDGAPFPEPERCRADFRAMAGLGLNAVRIYHVPPADVLDAAAEEGLRLLVGIHYDDWRMLPPPTRAGNRRVRDAGLRAVEEAMRVCAGRPEVLALAVGNEVPADLVRWYGARAVADVLAELVVAAHKADAAMPVTYVNYPTTEFLEVPGQDLVCFNVFLEDPVAWRSYLRHLQVVAGERPLLITECGLAATPHGEDKQAEALEWQLQTADELGIGAAVFSWTDEWGVDGRPVVGWGFGVTGPDRRPKPGVRVLRRWAGRPLCELRPNWPRLSVVVCAYNEEARLGACLASLEACDYPDLEVIVCDDGSSDRTVEVARGHPFRILALPRGGLSRARNAGLAAASGEIVAYVDGDAQCHPDWPYRLALAFEDPGVVAAGGPNLPVPGAGFAERVVAACPGGPIHVLLSDDRAEHLPGCNLAVRREALLAVGGFDEVFTSAGDDVDVCWKLQDRGGAVAFVPAAQVRHHRRARIAGYLRQQANYGRSERMVAGRHPHRFNRLGQARWRGFIYGGLGILPRLLRPVVYHGIAGEAPFQPVRRRTAEVALAMVSALLPLAIIPLAAGLVLSAWTGWGILLTGVVVAALAVQMALVAAATRPPRGEPRPFSFRLLVGAMHVAQPLVRAWGRIRGPRLEAAEPATESAWTGDRSAWLHSLRLILARRGFRVRYGNTGDEWDLEVRGLGLLVGRIRIAVAWRWTPAWRIERRPRALNLLWVAGAVLFGNFNVAGGLALGLSGLVLSLLDGWAILRSARAAMAESTRGVPIP